MMLATSKDAIPSNIDVCVVRFHNTSTSVWCHSTKKIQQDGATSPKFSKVCVGVALAQVGD